MNKERLLRISRQKIAFLICCIMMVALIYSKFVLTLGMILLMLTALFNLNSKGKFKLHFNPDFKNNVLQLWSRKDFLVITLFFLIVLVSGLYSSDMTYTAERLRIKLPFLLLPFAFISIPPFNRKQYFGIFYFFLLTMTFSALIVGFNYLQYYEVINKSMLSGQAIPTPTNHIRYSLLISLSILSGVVLWSKGFFIKYKWESRLIGGLTIFLFLFIHILSVRSGLGVLYISIFLLSLRFIFLTKRYLLGFAMIVGIATIPFLAYKMVPSIQAKIKYMQYDFDQYLHGNIKDLSDAERLVSMEAGLKIGSRNPIFGVGAGDLKKTIKDIYQEEYPNLPKPKMPHNQLISVFAGTGVIGLLVFLFAFFYPLYYRRNYRDTLFTVLHVIIFGSFFIENTIETAVGVAFYILFLLVGLNFLGNKQVNT